MAPNNGKSSEQVFETLLKLTRGKVFYLHRFTDAADVRGRTGRTGFQPNQPSDFISVIDNVLAFTEIKSTQDPTAFRFSLLKETQDGAARRIIFSGGQYHIYIHRIPTDQWFCVPYALVLNTKEHGRQSLKWSELEPEYLWT